MERLDEKTYLKHVNRIIEDLLKNAAHSFGLDFAVINEAAIETERRLIENGLTRSDRS